MSDLKLNIAIEASHRRQRRTSVASQVSNTSSQFTNAGPSVLSKRRSTSSVKSFGSETDRSEIYAPVPRRHHIQSSETRRWLDAQPASFSRPTSPLASRQPGSEASGLPPSPLTRRRRSEHRYSGFGSFPSLLHQASLDHISEQEPKHATSQDGMGRRWVRWMHEEGFRSWVVPTAVTAAVLYKWCIGLGSYSGQATPPMYGDYEAQRHWMELTIHLPISQWYKYDLEYWGLDYPPLTAYISWFFGILGSRINPSWFALDKSRGIETGGSKLFMRVSVLIADTLIYVPSLVMLIRTWHAQRSTRTQNLALLVLLFHPALLLVDFGHFQYNSVMLGFAVFAMNFFVTGHDLLGAICFVLSLGFKQMALYYAPAIGAYLLSKCLYLGLSQGFSLFVRLAVVTTLSFLVLFSPWLPPFASLFSIADPVTRIFPFNRGLFEDKVANFWCASDVVLKWRRWVSKETLVRLSAGLTAIGFAPAVIGLIYGGWVMSGLGRGDGTRAKSPTLQLLPYALLTSSMSFFLFSFQVHEKTILLPLMPLTLLLSGSTPDSATYEIGALVNNVAVFSMWPLLRRDGLAVQYVALLVFWNRLIGNNPFRKPQSLFHYLSLVIYSGAVILHALELLVTPPARYPDLFPVLNVLLSTPIFGLTWLWSIKRGVEVSWAMGGLGTRKSGLDKKLDDKSDSAVSTSKANGSAFGSGIGRHVTGARTQSLGFAQGRRRPQFRAASVDYATSGPASDIPSSRP